MLDFEYWRAQKHVVGAGVMAGTSLDGIDIAVVDFHENKIGLLYFSTFEYSKSLGNILKNMADSPIIHLEKLTRCHWTIGEEISRCINTAIKTCSVEVDFIASHGQTIYHSPDSRPGDVLKMGGTLQLGEASVIAENTGIMTLSDFRHADIAAGGQGAPLIPYFDYRYFSDADQCRVFINIGGIANFTIVPPNAKQDAIIAYDSGPGNMVIDALCSRLFDKPYDEAGELAAKGKVHDRLLNILLQDEYFHQAGPKSTGREYFGAQYVEKILNFAHAHNISAHDLLATITRLTASSIASAIKRELGEKSHAVCYISGGGWHNRTLIQMLKKDLKSQNLFEFTELGIPGDAKEAVGFATLGYATLIGESSNMPAATGAKRQVMLGKINWPGKKQVFGENNAA